MAIRIRRGVASDVEIIAEYNQRLAQESEDKSLEPAVVRAGVIAALADPDIKGPYYLAEIDGRVVGQLQITFEWSDWRNGWFWWIQGVYVPAEHRRQGVFRALYDHVLSLARQNPQVMAIRLYVEKENEVAQKTYLGLGMEFMSFQLMHYPLGVLRQTHAQG